MKEKESMCSKIKEMQSKNKEDFEKIQIYVKEFMEKTNLTIQDLK